MCRDSNLKGWELFAIASGAFPPSKEFEPYLLAYCHRHREDPVVGKHAAYAMGRLLMAQDLPPRKEIPTAIEVEAVKVRCRRRGRLPRSCTAPRPIVRTAAAAAGALTVYPRRVGGPWFALQEMRPVAVRVYHLDGSYDMMPVTSWTTPTHLNKMMAARLGIKDASAFALYEMTPEGEERYLEKDRILDLVAYWQRLFEEEKTKKQKKKEDNTAMWVPGPWPCARAAAAVCLPAVDGSPARTPPPNVPYTAGTASCTRCTCTSSPQQAMWRPRRRCTSRLCSTWSAVGA